MSVAPNAGVVDLDNFLPPTAGTDGVQGQVPKPLAGQQDYVLTANGWLPLSALGTLVFQGTWDASTNTPTLASGVGTAGYYYVVSVAGNTDLNGITTWTVGDWALFNGSVWQKIEGGSTVDITGGSINNTVIGNTTPNAATFTTLGVTTSVNASGAGSNVDLNVNSKGTGNVNIGTGNGTQFRVESSGSAATDFVMVGGSSTGRPFIRSAATSGNIDLAVSSQGTGAVRLYTNFVGQEQARVAHTASAVNFVQVTGAATGGNGPVISSQGSDANVNATIQTKGSGVFRVVANNAEQFRVNAVGSAANIIQVSGAASGSAPSVRAIALGGDTNVPLVLQPLGTGALQAQLNDGTATGGNARGAYAVDWQTLRNAASQVATTLSVIGGGQANTSSGYATTVSGGEFNTNAAYNGFIGAGASNSLGGNAQRSVIAGGTTNTANGFMNFIGGGAINSGTSGTAVTTQSATMNGTTAVTLSGSNANIRVGQIIQGTSINNFPYTYVAAISGTSLTLSQAASGSSTSTLSFFTPHGVVVGGGNNQATGAYSFIGGGGDAGTAANRNVASGDWSVVGGGRNNTASGIASFVGGGGFEGSAAGSNSASGTCSSILGGFGNFATGAGSSVTGGFQNTASGSQTSVVGGRRGTTRSIVGNTVFPACENPIADATGVSQSALLLLAVQTTDATATVLRSNTSAAGTTNQVILPNNSAYTFRGEVVSGVTGGGNSKSWTIEGLIKRGANAAATTLVGSTVTSMYADVGAATWTIALSADTTNGGLAVTFTGQAGTTIRTVARINTVEMTF